MRRRSQRLRLQLDGRVRVSLSLTEDEARRIEAAAGDLAPGAWCRWAALRMADRVAMDAAEKEE